MIININPISVLGKTANAIKVFNALYKGESDTWIINYMLLEGTTQILNSHVNLDNRVDQLVNLEDLKSAFLTKISMTESS